MEGKLIDDQNKKTEKRKQIPKKFSIEGKLLNDHKK